MDRRSFVLAGLLGAPMLKSENPVVAGTVLRRAAIQSPNFVTGSAGWAINQDGTAEFNNAVIRNGQVISGTSLYYSGPPAAGNLFASISAAAGTDPKGNAFVAGIATYTQAAPFLAICLQNGILTAFLATSQAGPYSNIGMAAAAPDNAGNLNLEAGSSLTAVQVTLGILSALHGATVAGGLTADLLTVTSGQANSALVQIQNTTAAPAIAIFRMIAQAAADRVLAIRVAGDTSARLACDSNGQLQWGSGAAAADSALFRAGANLLASDYLAFNNNGAAEVFQTVGGTGAAFANGWANAAAPGAPLQYQRVAAPSQGVQWVGRIVAPAGVAAGQAVTATVTAAYRPAHTLAIPARNITTPGTAWFSIGAAGTLTFQSGAVAGDNLDLAPTVLPLNA